MGIGLEHLRVDGAPHHQLDHALGDSFLDEVGDTAVAEDVGGDVFFNASPDREPAELLADSCMGEWHLIPVEKDEGITLRSARVILSPLGEVLFSHDDADIAGYPGLEVHIHNHTIAIEFEISPFHDTDLTDAKSPFIQKCDEGPVHAPPACLDDGTDFIGSEKGGGGLGHGIFPGGL